MTDDGKDRSMSSPVGTWELVSFTSRLEDGRSIEPWPQAVGRIAYDDRGNFTSLLMSGRLNQADGRDSPPEAQDEFSAFFGTYQVDSTHGIVTLEVSASLNGRRASKVLRRSFELSGDTLVLGFPTIRNGMSATNRLVWKRIGAMRKS